MGAFLNIILDVNITIDQTYFVDGIAYSGGAIYIQGSSDILITNSFFVNNFAYYSGGAIYANGFNSVIIQQSSQFSSNRALQYGDDFYLTNSLNNFTIMDSLITSKNAMTSTYADGISLWVFSTTYQDIYLNTNSQQGAAI